MKQVQLPGFIVNIIDSPLIPVNEVIVINPARLGLYIKPEIFEFNEDYVAILITKKDIRELEE